MRSARWISRMWWFVFCAVAMAAAGCGSAGGGSSSSGGGSTGTASNTASLARGVDISWMTQLPALGYSFVGPAQTPASALQILKDHGVTAVRIRTFVNPSITAGTLGVGNTDQAGSIALAQTAAAMGFAIMIDFHLSDTWADPGHQAIPAAWASYNYTQMQTAVSSYIQGFMQALAADGIYPQWVQVGNEIDGGMLWPIGSTSNFAQLAGLINSDYKAVKAVSPSTLVVIHHSTLSNLANLEWFFDTLQADGGSFDAIGVSYYDGPDTLTTSAANLSALAARYSKPVLICEIGHTESDFMGAADDVKSAMEALAGVPGNLGRGIFYWEP